MKILYILGRGRGGSTVLANVLGEIDGFFSAGEVRYLWDPVVVRQSPCGCGAPIGECALWSKVLAKLNDVDLDQVVRWQHEIVRESNVFRLIHSGGRRRWPALENYAAVTARLYRTIQEVTGCEVVVDSSKRPSYAAFIKMLDGCEPYFVHLVRDPRASAYSWHARRYASAHGAEVTRRNAFDSTLRWDLLNLGSEILRSRSTRERFMRLRYEDFAATPLQSVKDICALIDRSQARLPFVDDRTVELNPNHTIAGNPSRFATGRLVLKDSGEWYQRQRRWSQWVATAVALPLLRRYGYGLRPHG
ncbi:MAG: sulfotransferase [Actinomycetota bacterium]|nr:sulfotransferase [Actinomycetota bacterium]